LVASDDWYTGR